MPDEKIRISWDDVNSPQVDLHLKQQEVLIRAQQHYQQASPPPLPPGRLPAPIQPTSIWYNSLFYMALFGLFGGLGAWGCGEITDLVAPTNLDKYQRFLEELIQIEQQYKLGDLSDAEAQRRFEAVRTRYANNPLVRLDTDQSIPAAERRAQEDAELGKMKWQRAAQSMLFFGLAGLCIAFSLSISEPIVSRNPRAVLINGGIGACLGLLGGMIVGSFIDLLYNALGGGNLGQPGLLFKQIFARTLGWTIVGLFLATAPGFALKSPKRLVIGLGGGLIGGCIGGATFDLIGMSTNTGWLSRLISFIAIGTITGFATGLIEAAAKSGWLRVTAGLIAGKQFILYRDPTYIGSSPQCEIYLFKDPLIGPQHAAVHKVPGGFELQDLGSSSGTFVNGRGVSRTRLRNNDQMQIGSTCFLFQEKSASD